MTRFLTAARRYMSERWEGVGRVLLIVLLLALIPSNLSRADEDSRIIEERVVTQLVHWQLARWQDGVTVCNIYLSHDLQPNASEISRACGQETLNAWLATPSCAEAQGGGTGASSCSGLLLRYIGTQTFTYTRQIELPRIRMWLEVVDCRPGEVCANRPRLRVVAEEPLAGHRILRVHIRIGDRERMYDGADAELHLPLTNEAGGVIQFWAESDFGDVSERYEVKFRNVQRGAKPGQYRFDLLTPDWRDTLPNGALLWQAFPPLDESMPFLFERPLTAGYLSTTNRYALLAGRLIRAGEVDASACPDRGLTSIGAASSCGESVAAQAVLAWQNKYDAQIFDASLKYDIPARLLKGMIAQESQFWPLSDNPYERGLGYVSEDGVALLLLWNTPYYLDVCLPIYGKSICAAGYANLREDRQTVLRGAVFGKIGTPDEIDVLGAMLYASAAQTGQMVRNVYRTDPGDAMGFVDLWKLAVANYYAGSGCVGAALRGAAQEERPVKWDSVAGYLEGKCQIAIDYVKRVMQYSE